MRSRRTSGGRGPKDGGWSAAEIVGHLIMVERSVVGSADRVIQHPPRRFSRLQKLHFPLALVEARLVKRKTPIARRSGNAREKETMLAELRDIRERTLAFMDETKERNLGLLPLAPPVSGEPEHLRMVRNGGAPSSSDTKNKCGK